ncbi:MAG: xanthine dehydrogenase family protein subunit M [Alphaproteobacteria bacterium]|nr:MAG: xanthine dehydrogenase family protein subunit M [Alphaproteobacteria bacterium]
MKPPPFTYHDPATVTEAIGLLASLDNAKLLAGGQSLMPMLNMRYAQPDHVIDLNRVEGLSAIREAGDGLEIGAMTRQREVEFSDDVERLCPLLHEAMPLVGHRQTRNRGTFGGSLAHFDSSAEIPTVCAALDAIVRVQGPGGARDIAFKDFAAGYLSTSMGLDEVLLSVQLPAWGAGHGFGFEEFARRHGDFAIVSAAALLEAGPDGRITRASLTLGGIGSAPLRMAPAEAALVGAPGSAETFAAAAETCRGIDALEDIHAPAVYRQHLAVVLSRRALEKAWSRMDADKGG